MRVLEVLIAFHIFPLRQHFVAHKSQSHPSAYTPDSCGILL